MTFCCTCGLYPSTQHLAFSSFSYTSGEGGHAIFQSKGCIKCHTGKLALDDRLHNLTLTDIAVDVEPRAAHDSASADAYARRM